MNKVDASNNEPPILCLDTCSILDLLRDPSRRKVKLQEHSASLDLLTVAESRINLEVWIASKVVEEYREKVAQVQRQTKSGLSNFRKSIGIANQLVELHGATGEVKTEHWGEHADRCRQAADRWVQIAKKIEPPDDIADRVYRRGMKPLPPARKGEANIEDCEILETYLARVTEMRRTSCRTAVFVSSNTNDFANEKGSELADELRCEFQHIDLKYAPNMRIARRLLNLISGDSVRSSRSLSS